MDSKQLKHIRQIVNGKVNLADYFNTYVFPKKERLTQLGAMHTGSICPFHNENDPSFRYYANSNRFKCFGCGLSGDVVRLHQLTERHYNYKKLTDEEALRDIIRMYELGIDIDEVIENHNPYEECREKLDLSTIGENSVVKLFERQRRVLKSETMGVTEKMRVLNQIDDMAVVYELLKSEV